MNVKMNSSKCEICLNKFNKEEYQKLVNSMIDHLHDVIKAKGDATIH